VSLRIDLRSKSAGAGALLLIAVLP